MKKIKLGVKDLHSVTVIPGLRTGPIHGTWLHIVFNSDVEAEIAVVGNNVVFDKDKKLIIFD